MKLNVNNNHKTADVSNLKLFKNKFFISFLGMAISMSLFSGCKKEDKIEVEVATDSYSSTQSNTVPTEEIVIDNTMYTTSESTEVVEETKEDFNNIDESTEVVDIVDENGFVNIPESYRYDVASACGKNYTEDITIGDLAEIEDFCLIINNNDDLSWLKYCTNLKSLFIYINCDGYENIKYIKNIPNLESLYLVSLMDNSQDFCEENFGFIRDMTTLTELYINYNFNVEPGLIESLTNLRTLILQFDYDCDIDFSKLTFLDNLEFGALPYSVVISLDTDDYNTLVNNGVKISFSKDEYFDKFYSANKMLDEIINSFNLDENANDQEKLDAILIYVLDNLSYDQEVSATLRSGGDAKSLAYDFYTYGALHGFFEKDTAICGNYAALVDALAYRLNLKSFVARSNNHAWNIISVEGENYYVDATWLDGTSVMEKTEEYDEFGYLISQSWSSLENGAQIWIARGDGGELEWYMKDPTEIDASKDKEAHDIINLPCYITIRAIEDEEVLVTEPTESIDNTLPTEEFDNTIPTESISKNEDCEQVKDITNKKFEISIGDRKWIISGAVLIGILSGLGIAVGVNKRRKRKRAERRRREEEAFMAQYGEYYSDYGYDSSYGSSYSSSYGSNRKR